MNAWGKRGRFTTYSLAAAAAILNGRSLQKKISTQASFASTGTDRRTTYPCIHTSASALPSFIARTNSPIWRRAASPR